MDFDFDDWAKLAKEDPGAFERRRAATLKATIDGAPETFRQRLEGLQCQLDLERGRSATPLASCVRMNTLMWAGFFRLRKELISERAPRNRSQPGRTAEVIPLRGRRRGGTTREGEG